MSKKEIAEYMGKRLKEIRKEAGLSSEHIAQVLSMSRSAVCNMEHGRQDITNENLYKICQLLKVYPNDFYPKIEFINYEFTKELITVIRTVKVIKATQIK